ncbi:MAG TPA: tryptophan synthase subunit alpha [Gammaproteobacteria bacterium]|nr:tryptophan synthase subunit alpha [Gammaproteobacteria bacterium]
MSRIADVFARLRGTGRKALIPFITAGDPDPDATVPLMHTLVAAGADIIELGVPFSDPMAEGPVIQKACERALAHHVSLKQVLAMVARFRVQDRDTPVVLMGYLNPVEVMGCEAFAAQAAAAGVDGALIVDMPPEEGGEYIQAARAHGLDTVFLLSPTSTAERIARIAAASRGFVYYVSLKGITGASHLDVASVTEKLNTIRPLSDLPIGVGFGIHDGASAAAVAQVADAVVVGSALVKGIAAAAGRGEDINGAAAALVGEMRRAMDKAVRTA